MNNNTEYETKVLNINVQQIIESLTNLGAKKIADYYYRRYVYGLGKGPAGWIRLRTDGYHTTLTFKSKVNQKIEGTTEIETTVGDFDTAHQIILQMNITDCKYQENKRILYQYQDIEFCIDTWPLLPSWLEVESTSLDKVHQGLALLNLTGKDIGNLSAAQTAKQYYNIDLLSYDSLTFD